MHDLTHSCGCLRHRGPRRDITGQRFGRLLAVEPAGGTRNNSVLWRCKCDCGNIKEVTCNELVSGNTRSCGCLAAESRHSRYLNIAGQRFGRLIAVEPTEKRSGDSVVWRCRCDCGNECERPLSSLRAGKAKSCGCAKGDNDSLKRNLSYVEGTCIQFIDNTGKLSIRNTSGCRGVRAFRNKWQASITFKKQTYHLGTFANKDDAIEARHNAEMALYGEFLDWYYKQYPPKATTKGNT